MNAALRHTIVALRDCKRNLAAAIGGPLALRHFMAFKPCPRNPASAG
jgi:hypothetical protein